MSPTRRQALAQLAGLAALPLARWSPGERTADDPLDGTIAAYQAGRRAGRWTAAEVTARALDRCRTAGARWHAIDALSDTALDDARAADARLRAGRLRGPLDGVPVFSKAIVRAPAAYARARSTSASVGPSRRSSDTMSRIRR